MKINARILALLIFSAAWNVPAATNIFYSTNSVVIPTDGPASSYPWYINVSGVAGLIQKVTVTLRGFNHFNGSDVDILLASPFGTNLILLSNVGIYQDINNVELTFDDDAINTLSQDAVILSGTYKTADYSNGEYYLQSAPPINATNLISLAGNMGNGAWGLYIFDGFTGLGGSISNWVLTIITSDTNRPPVIAPVLPQMVNEGSNLVFHVSATDSMDNDFITLTASNLPAGLVFSATNANTIAHGSFTWLSAAPAGVYTSQLYAADNDGTSSVDIVITVKSTAIPYPEYKITSIASSGGNLVIRWASTNLIYRLNSSTNLSLPNSFVPVVNNITGTPPENAVTTTPAAANAAYQVEIVP